jgi:hypothetical protein
MWYQVRWVHSSLVVEVWYVRIRYPHPELVIKVVYGEKT